MGTFLSNLHRLTHTKRLSLRGRTSQLPLRGRQTAQGETWYRSRSRGGDALRGASTVRRPARSKETPTMLANLENVLDRPNVASRNGEKAMPSCPAHNDQSSPSLSLQPENGKLLLHCFAGCKPEDIVSKVGLGMQELFAEGGGGSSIPQRTPARLHAQSEK